MTLRRFLDVCPRCARDLSFSFVELVTNLTMSNYHRHDVHENVYAHSYR